LDAVGHKEAFEYVIELADKNATLNERTIKELHSIVLMNDRENAGKYRTIAVRILGAKHTPPQPYLVPVQMERLVADYEQIKASKHIIEAVSEFHLRFESIHPFIDGNGRTGRLVLNLELIKAGLLPVNIKFADRQRYYSCFDAFALEKTCEPLANLISEYEEEELTKRIATIKGE
jgi:Fic family protein